MYSVYKGKSVVAKRFIRTLKSKVYKHMTEVSKIVHIDKIDGIINRYNNNNNNNNKMKPGDVKPCASIEYVA